ncbi:MAG: ATP-binding protein [Myxococcota bacterium]
MAAEAGVDDALDELVNQFSDPLSFLRELVQNSIDAGSQEIEISTTRESSSEDGQCVAVIAVSDWGGGMTREIIESKLTRLFSSNKDGDRTKIGKFGIGFVSVFAIEPDAVCVDTSRDGETWRVLFDAKRTFKLLKIEDPIEGTTVRVFKSMPEDEFDPFAGRVRDTVVYWCKHAECDIHVDGDPIAVPFAFSSPCSVDVDDGYSRVAISHEPDHRTFFGFYNGGLTLKESRKSDFPSLHVRVWSPHLEHTLTRDAVIEDEGYARVLEAVTAAIDGPLVERVFSAFDEAIRSGTPGTTLGYLFRCVEWHLIRGVFPSSIDSMVLARSPSGRSFTVAELRDDPPKDRILIAQARGPLSDQAEAAGEWVIEPLADEHLGLLQRLCQGRYACVPLHEQHVLVLPLRSEIDPKPLRALADAASTLFKNAGHKVSEVVFGHFDHPGSGIAEQVAVAQKDPFTLSPASQTKVLGQGILSRSRPIVVNVDHPTTRELVRLAASDPPLAAYMLTKLFFLGNTLTPALDGQLAEEAAGLEYER